MLQKEKLFSTVLSGIEAVKPINQRISDVIAHSGLSVLAFSVAIGQSRSTLYNVVGDRQGKPNHEMLSSILAHFPDVQPGWLLHGEGEMLFPELNLTEVKEKAKALALKISAQRHGVRPVGPPLTVDEANSLDITPTDRDQEDAIPFVPIAAEGSYLQGFADEEYIEHMPKFYLPFLGLGQGVYAFQVRGDSMSDRFNNGDVVFGQKVESNDALRWGEVYVLLCNDGLVVKELRKGPDDQHFTLRSFNEHFDPYDILKSEVRQLFRYQASISFNSSNPNRVGVVNFLRGLSEQMGQIQNSLGNLPGAK